MTLWSAILFGIGVLVLFRAAFNLYRTIRSYFPTRVRLRDEFQSDWALIVGANSGLGRHLALMVADEHVNIIGAGLDDRYLESTGRECESRNVQFVPVPVDLMDLSSVSTIVAACESRDVGIVLLNAGLGNFEIVSDLDDERIERYFNLMCTSYSLLVREFLKRNWGRKDPSVIYITASLAADLMVPRSCLYCATKSYLSRLGQCIALETAGTNVRISVMQPGFFGASRFFTPVLKRLIEGSRVAPGSDAIARAVMRTIGRTVIADCTVNSALLRAAEWMVGELPFYWFARFILWILK